MQHRKNNLTKWLSQVIDNKEFIIDPITGDASFRHYYRLRYHDQRRIVMDAPPDKEPLDNFIAISNFLRAHGIRSPQFFAINEPEGFAIIEDFGDGLFLNNLNPENLNARFDLALSTLVKLQECPLDSEYAFPVFDKAHMIKELSIFTEWFLQGHLKKNLTTSEQTMLADQLNWLVEEISKQPQVLIHRDYHSRNLMIVDDNQDLRLGVIDFQDAMRGPFTYDLVSILKDCYYQLPRQKVQELVNQFYQQSTVAQQWTLAEFTRGFELCGLQRHLKVLGVFSRLCLRDNKQHYLNDLPLTLHYVLDCLESYKALDPLYQFMRQIHL